MLFGNYSICEKMNLAKHYGEWDVHDINYINFSVICEKTKSMIPWIKDVFEDHCAKFQQN